MERLSPLLKRTGGKEQELKYITPALPKNFENYYEPFIGGGAVYFSIDAKKYYINDKSEELIGLYRILISQEEKIFFEALYDMINNWNTLEQIVNNNKFGLFSKKDFINLYNSYNNGEIENNGLKEIIKEVIFKNEDIYKKMFTKYLNYDIDNFIDEINRNLFNKIKRMKVIEKEKGKMNDKDILDNIETAFKSSYYMQIRYLYNNKEKLNLPFHIRIAIFLFIRNYAYSGMFRYNSSGEFNVPYGGIGYNSKNFKKKLEYLQSDKLKNHLKKTIIDNKDFEVFFKDNKPTKNDFIFLDPPYDSEFSTYDKNVFNKDDQIRLANYLLNCKAKWMMVIKNTEFIFSLYNDKGLNISSFDKKYLVSFMNRNNKEVKHLLITNY